MHRMTDRDDQTRPASDRPIASWEDVRRLQGMAGLAALTIDARTLKFDGLLPVALRRAFAAVVPGGRITIIGDGRGRSEPPVLDLTFNQVRQTVLKFLGDGCELVELDPAGRITMRRTRPALPQAWSAGVMYSGAAAEGPTLRRCLDALVAQPELAGDAGEIVVCGPSDGDRAFLSDYPGVRYLAVDGVEDDHGRFLLAKKKNALIDALAHARMVVLHARVVLAPDALSRVPAEFDILAPNIVRIRRNGNPEAYMSLAQIDRPWPGYMLRRRTLMLRDVRGCDPLRLHAAGPCYVDGGAVFVTRPVFDRCRMDDRLGWAEGEDVDWCMRAFLAGFISDLAVEARATSLTSKWTDHALPGAVEQLARRATGLVQQWRGRLRHIARPSLR
jgi:hypothetical protein